VEFTLIEEALLKKINLPGCCRCYPQCISSNATIVPIAYVNFENTVVQSVYPGNNGIVLP
jgi:hypothetical protein